MNEKKHKILRHPIAALFILFFAGFFFYQLCGFVGQIIGMIVAGIRGEEDIVGFSSGFMGFGAFAGGVIALFLHWLAFRPEFKGCFSKTFFRGRDTVICTVIACVVLFGLDLADVFTNELEFTAGAVGLALMAGVCEEMAVRVLPASVMMGDWKDGKYAALTAVLTSVLFGVIHFMNALMGASLDVTVVQVIMAIGIGLFFASLYLRTGNILLCMIIHALHDYLAFIIKGSYSAGIIQGELTVSMAVGCLGIGILFGVLGMYLLRRSVRDDITAVWRERWSMDEISTSENETVTE